MGQARTRAASDGAGAVADSDAGPGSRPQSRPSGSSLPARQLDGDRHPAALEHGRESIRSVLEASSYAVEALAEDADVLGRGLPIVGAPILAAQCHRQCCSIEESGPEGLFADRLVGSQAQAGNGVGHQEVVVGPALKCCEHGLSVAEVLEGVQHVASGVGGPVHPASLRLRDRLVTVPFSRQFPTV